jgi:hypothetical protein
VLRFGDLLASRKNVALRMRARSIQRELDALAKKRGGEEEEAEGDEGAESGRGKVIPFKRRDTDRSKLN